MSRIQQLLLGILGFLTHQRDISAQRHGEIMAQLDDLNAKIDTITTQVAKTGQELQQVVTELQKANQNPAIDLTAQIAKLQGISNSLTQMDALVPDTATDTPTPATAS